jgi:hypothetical protein
MAGRHSPSRCLSERKGHDRPNGADGVRCDDDPSVRKSLARLVRAVGYEVEAFVSARAFLARPNTIDVGCGGGYQSVGDTFELIGPDGVPAPEPSSFLLLAAGLIGVAARIWRARAR